MPYVDFRGAGPYYGFPALSPHLLSQPYPRPYFQQNPWPVAPVPHTCSTNGLWPGLGRPYSPHAPQTFAPESFYRQAEEDPRLQQPLTFVLIHGSWADAAFWNGIAAELRRKGHTVYAPEYPGHGKDPNKDVTHAMITRFLANYIMSNRLRDIVLVGHSFGGTLVQKVAELVPERIKRLVFLNAFVLKDGQSTADELPPQVRTQFEQLAAQSGNHTLMLPFPLYRDGFVNLTGLRTARQMYNRITPEPAKPLFEKLDLTKFYSLELPKSYVYLTEDNVLPQGGGYGWHPHMSGRLGLFRLIKDRGDHMSTAKEEPARLAQRLYEAGRD